MSRQSLALIFASIVVCAIIMNPASAPAQTDVSGSIPTTSWTKANSPYRATGTITLLASDTLTIEAGVHIDLSNGTLRVAGQLNAIGTETDSIRIEGGRIEFVDAAPSVLRYVAHRGAVTTSLPLAVKEFYGGGILIEGSIVLMEHSVVEKHTLDVGHVEQDYHYVYGGGIAVLGPSRVTLRDCAVRGNILNSTFTVGQHDNRTTYSSARGGGIFVGEDASLVLDRCEIVDNYTRGQSGGGIAVLGTLEAFNSLFARNTLQNVSLQDIAPNTANIYHMQGYAVGAVNPGTASLTNCTIAANTALPGVSNARWAVFGAVTLKNSIVWGNSTDSAPPDPYWQYTLPVANYSNVLDADIIDVSGEGNIAADPLFADTSATDYSLLPGSPAIDAGDPDSPLEADGSRADMGVSTGTHILGYLVVVEPAVQHTPNEIAVLGANHGIESITIDVDLPDGWSTSLDVPFALLPGESFTMPLARTESSAESGTVTFTPVGPGISGSIDVSVSFEPSSGLPGIIATRTLTVDQSPYTLSVAATVPDGETLTVEAGIEIQIAFGASLTVVGKLLANGTSEAPVRFVQATEQGRGPINIIDGARAELVHTIIRDGNMENGGALRVQGTGTKVWLDSCQLVDNIGYRYRDRGDYSSPYHGTGGALYIRDGGEVSARGCLIARNASGYAGAIHIYDGTLKLARCVITDNVHRSWGAPVGPPTAAIRVEGDASVVLGHCTVGLNRVVTGGSYFEADLYHVGGSLTIVNSVLGFLASHDEAPEPAVRYTYQYCSTSPYNQLEKIGEYFVDAANGDFRPAHGSPLIGAADPASPYPDVGAIPYDNGVRIEQPDRPLAFNLEQNAPNPFNPRTTLRFSIAEPGAVRFAIYDVNGRLVRTLVDGMLPGGHHELTWDGTDAIGRSVASGVYVYRLTSGGNVATRRMVLIR